MPAGWTRSRTASPRTVVRRRDCAGLCAAALLCAPLPAVARELLVEGSDPALVEAVCARLADRGARSAEELFPSTRGEAMAVHARAAAQLEQARAAYAAGDFAHADEQLGAAISAYEESLAQLRDFGPLVRAYLLRADLAMARGDSAAAEDSFMLAARYGSGLQLDPAQTSPLVVEGLETARELLANSPSGTLRVSTAQPDVELWVDGVDKGTAPLALELPAGPHLLQARLAGYQDMQRLVPVDPGMVRAVMLELELASPVVRAVDEGTSDAVAALREVDPGRDWVVVLREGEALRYGLLLRESGPHFGGPVALEDLAGALASHGWEGGAVELGTIGLIVAAAGGGVVALTGAGTLALDGTLFFTDAGDRDQRLGMQLAERLLLGACALGAVVGAAGAGLWLWDLPRATEEPGEDAPKLVQPPAAPPAEGEAAAPAAEHPAAGGDEAAGDGAKQGDGAAGAEDAAAADGAETGDGADAAGGAADDTERDEGSGEEPPAGARAGETKPAPPEPPEEAP